MRSSASTVSATGGQGTGNGTRYSRDFTNASYGYTTGYTPPAVNGTVPTNGLRSFTRTGTAEIDFDGSPTAYGPNGGDDYLANAGHPGKWWGVATDRSGNPVINPENGHYVSSTAWQRGPSDQQSSFVDAQKVPFVAMNAHDKAKGVKNGDFVLLTNQATGKQVWAVGADYAGDHPDDHTEISAAAGRALGLQFNKRGVEGHFSMQFFPGTATGVFPQGENANYIAMGPTALQSNTMVASASHAGTVTGLAGNDIKAAPVASRFNSMASSAPAAQLASSNFLPVPALALAA